MPIFVGSPSKVKVQFFISELALNMAMLTAFENRGLLRGHRVSSTYVKTFIPNFEEVFGKHSDVFLLIEALSSPKVQISHDASRFTAEASLRLLNPFNEEFEALYMVLKIDANIQFELLQDFTLIANIEDSKLEVTEFETYFQSKVTVSQMNKKLDSLKEPAIKMTNSFLGMGKGLPIPKQIEAELSKTRLFTYDHFLMVESDPSIE